jgi:hypothetical protein
MLARLVFALGLAMTCDASCRAAMDDGFPAEITVTPTAQHWRLNGLPLEIELLSAPMAPRQACVLIAERWARSHRATLPGCRQNGDWVLASLCVDSQELTVQLRGSPQGSRGYVSRIDLRARPGRTPTARVRLLPEAKVLNVLQSSGPEGEAVQFTVAMPVSTKTAVRWLTAQAARDGWKVTAPAQAWTSGGIFELRRGNVHARGMLTPGTGGSGLVLVETYAGGPPP